MRSLSADVKLLLPTHPKPKHFTSGGSSTCVTTKVALTLRGRGDKVTHESAEVRTAQNVCTHMFQGGGGSAVSLHKCNIFNFV